MTKIYDCFLFFQELDLLQIRLEYLHPYVDKFIILEAAQTFSGKAKKFLLQENWDRFKLYQDKIIYHKIDEFHQTEISILCRLESDKLPPAKYIIKALRSLPYNTSSQFQWFLESYHRESIQFPLYKIADPEDIVFISDLDEFPPLELLSQVPRKLFTSSIVYYYSHEFRYFLDNYCDSTWLGSFSGVYRYVSQSSLNQHRTQVREQASSIFSLSQYYGHHFTHCGGVQLLKNKIQSYSHSEYNNPFVINNLINAISSGRDIFMNNDDLNLQTVNLYTSGLYNSRLRSIIATYPHLLQSSQNYKISKFYSFSRYFSKTFSIVFRLLIKLSNFLTKH